ncbi:hypothetical protein IVB55_25850 [Bradyrhizobium sp. CW4]|uniref:hypothetical protein n=1 Tax=Bradyrhizobium sp. CW4 TaxID=2782687 RepID=UPI001FF72AF6|nr:hypothetical protein [Bradyrhizobium sp. CW4]MCK1416329.1 hypothetical protein [Bradyrhizobium sp. CW4]
MASFKPLMPFLSVYFLGSLLTAGHFYRTHQRRLGVSQAICVLFWPAWWLLEYSPKEIFEGVSDVTMGTENRACVSLGIGLFAAGQFLSSNWETCSSGVACTGVLLKSSAMIFPPVGAAYLTWFVSQFA